MVSNNNNHFNDHIKKLFYSPKPNKSYKVKYMNTKDFYNGNLESNISFSLLKNKVF